MSEQKEQVNAEEYLYFALMQEHHCHQICRPRSQTLCTDVIPTDQNPVHKLVTVPVITPAMSSAVQTFIQSQFSLFLILIQIQQ